MALKAIYVRALGGDKSRGILQAGNLRLPCALGRAGISAFKREGDGATPRAVLHIAGGYYRAPLPPKGAQSLRLKRATAQDGWCDASGDRNYNRPVRLPYAAGAETMRRTDHLYDICLILDWNMRPRIKGRGSAVFLHIARPAGEEAGRGQSEGISKFAARQFSAHGARAAPLLAPTAGCIALRRGDMLRLLPLLGQETQIITL